jgi:spermidine synthase
LIRLTALLITVVTGFTGLVYEVTWQKYLATLLGSHSEATAAVLAIFLGGLSVGYTLFGEWTRRIARRARASGGKPRLLLAYGAVEAGIGVYALLFPHLFGLASQLSLWGPTGHAGLGFAFDVGLSALLIGPPSVLMGATIPFLTMALSRSVEQATRVHAWVYGFNTLGAFAGALAAGFVLIERLGLDGVVYAVGVVNLLAGGLFVLLDRFSAQAASDLVASADAQPDARPRLGAWAVTAGLAGFAMMTLQTTLNRIGALTFGSSEFTFAMIVSVFVLSIALGSLAVSAMSRIPRGLVVGTQWLLVLLLFGLYGPLEDASYWAHVMRTAFSQEDTAFGLYYTAAFQGLLTVLLVPIALAGALLPLLFHALRREMGELGSVSGSLYGWNTLGSLAGALIGGYVLFFWLDLHQVYRVAVAALVVGTAILTVLVARTPWVATGALVVLPALAALWALPAWEPERLASGLFRYRKAGAYTHTGADASFEKLGTRYIYHRDGPTISVSVHEPADGGPLQRAIINNGKSDGSLDGDYPTMALTALVPALMAESIERSFIIGWGTGVTAGELAALEDTREVEVAEISLGVIEAAPLFDRGNLEASKNPKVRIVRGDAYRTLLRDQTKWDLILSEPSNPWVTGVEMLFSVEFLETARERLAPGGVYAQWFHLYEIDEEAVELVLRTYAAVFPHVSVWYTKGLDLLLLGLPDAERALDVAAMRKRFRQPDFFAGFRRAGVRGFPALLAHELIPLGTLHAGAREGELHTLRHPILSHRAARAFFRGKAAELPRYAKPAEARVGARNSLLRRFGGGQGRVSQDLLERVAREHCRSRRTLECATTLARWKFEHPGELRADELRKELLPRARRELGNRNLDSLVVFFGRGGVDRLAGKTPLNRAKQASANYLQHFYQPFPFERRVLRALWKACDAPDCDEERDKVEERVGILGAPRAESKAGAP